MLFELNAFFPLPCLLLLHGHVKSCFVSLKMQSAEQVIKNLFLWCWKLNALSCGFSVWVILLFDYLLVECATHTLNRLIFALMTKSAFQTKYWLNKFALQQQSKTALFWLALRQIDVLQSKQNLSRAMIVMLTFAFH